MFLGFFRFQQVAAGNNDAFLFRIDFDDFRVQFLAHVGSEVINVAQFHMGCRHKPFDAFHGDSQADNRTYVGIFRIAVAVAFLDDTQDFDLGRAFFAFRQRSDILPGSFLFRTNLGETDEIFGARRDDDSFHFVAFLDRIHQIFVVGINSPILPGDQTIACITEIDINAVFIYLTDLTVDELAGMNAKILHAGVEHRCKIAFHFLVFHVFHCHDSLLNYAIRS